MRAVGKEAGLKSFEQVSNLCRCLEALNQPPWLYFPLCHFYFLLPTSYQVKDIHLHPETFTIANGLLTPTLKSRRVEIRKFFEEQITTMYNKTGV